MMEDTFKAIERIRRDLGLPAADIYTQDWAYELPEEYRSQQYFQRYATAYARADYGDAEKHELMRLMLDITNELLDDDETAGLEAWNTLKAILAREPALHRDLVDYWALSEEPSADGFALTPFVRTFSDEVRER